MEWKKFLIANALGATAWVVVISFLGYAFASTFTTLLHYFKTVGWAMSAGLFLLGYLLWRRQQKKFKERHSAGF